MSETTETKAQEAQISNPQDSVFGKYADQLAEKRAAQKVETPVAETTSAVTEEVKAENAPAAEIPKEPSSNGKAKDPIKEVAAPKEEAIAEPEQNDDSWRKELGFDDSTTTPVIAESRVDDKQVLNEYKEKLQKLEKLTEDPFIAAYKAHIEAGKDVSSFLNVVKGRDINAMTPDQLWEESLNAETDLTAEDKAISMEKFAELDKFEKIQKTKTFKQELIAQQAEQLKKYAGNTAQEAAKQAEQAKQLAIMAEQQSKQFFNKIKDKEWQGMKMTPSEINKLETFLENDFKFQNADGTLNYELYAKVGNYALNERTILQNVAKKAETRGYEKALAEFARANKNDQRFNSAPDVKSKNRGELAKQASKEAFASPLTN